MASKIKVDEIEGSTGTTITLNHDVAMASGKTLPAASLTGTVADARISTLTASKLTGALPAISGANLTGITTNLDDIKADITALALREATNESSAAFNLPNSFIETFTDDTNLGTQTTGGRGSGYWATIYSSTGLGRFSSDSDTSFLLHSNTTDGNQTFTDSSSNAHTISTLGNANAEHSTDFPPPTYLGTTAIHGDGSGGLQVAGSADWNMGTGDFCMEWWEYSNGVSSVNARTASFTPTNECYFRPVWTNSQWVCPNIGGTARNAGSYGSYPTNGNWIHRAFNRQGNVFRVYIGGVHWTAGGTFPYTSSGNLFATDANLFGILGAASWSGEFPESTIYITEMRISKGNNRYPDGTTFTPNQVTTSGNNATGTLIQSANAVGSAKTKVGGTLLYKDNAGTATLGTGSYDLKVEFTCNGGTNWTEAASYNAITPVYSSGIKMVRLGETTCTSGTDVRYRAVFANQASGSKETQLHGIGINY